VFAGYDHPCLTVEEISSYLDSLAPQNLPKKEKELWDKHATELITSYGNYAYYVLNRNYDSLKIYSINHLMKNVVLYFQNRRVGATIILSFT
jgi:hypothetical protein